MSRLAPTLPSAILLLEDGSIFQGFSFGADLDELHSGRIGEVVFNTAMSGYEEVLTDRSYYEQIVIMTYPQVGIYGINSQDMESKKVWLKGFIVHEYAEVASNYRAEKTLRTFLQEQKIPAFCGIDTRALTRHIRDKGAMNAFMLSPVPPKDELQEVLQKLKAQPPFGSQDLVAEVTCKESYAWQTTCNELNQRWGVPKNNLQKKPKVLVLDFGAKLNILRHFATRGCEVMVFPANTSAEKILEQKPDGLFLSNGPGDPAKVEYAAKTVAKLLGRIPIFGICMGHQVLTHALGAKTYKMKFGHHGVNQPVLDIASGKVIITSQNHGYAVDPETLPSTVKVSQINLNDKTVEGISISEKQAFSVQYHPEACPGPRDANFHFDDFMRMLWK